ncbi:hypothetical protein [Streptomyces narbonensis]|uniref:hypothetical protein n=1 Tax=Streptomyces narbonensis TaxID=67333 RepID=UPI0033EFB48B
MPILFIHGITVRRDRYDYLLSDVAKGFAAATTLPLTVKPCYWGDLGRSASYTGVSIPGFNVGARTVDPELRPDSRTNLLSLMLEDPLAELRPLRDTQDFDGLLKLPEGVERRNEILSEAMLSVTGRVAAEAASFAGPYDPPDANSVTAVVTGIFHEARRADRSLTAAALCPPMARALTAGLYRETMKREEPLAIGFRWNRAVEVVESALNAEDRLGGERAAFKDRIKDLAADSLTLALRNGLRNRIMPGLSLFLGDTFAYFNNRSEILERVEKTVSGADTDGSLSLIGHSLGGVIAYEYCQQAASRDIQLLGTVGSQVGLFGELGVLSGPTPTTAGKLQPPANVRQWRNIYDPDDVLSFLAAPVFERVRDMDIDTGAPFPAAHSEYWNLPGTYRALAAGVAP